MLRVVITFLLVGLSAQAMAQDEEPPRTSSPTPRYSRFTDYFKCSITEVLPGPVLMVKDEQTRSFRFLELKPSTSLKAKKKSEFGGRKKLELEDLAAGQQIKVTYLIETGEILKVQVLARGSDPQ